MYAFEWYNAQLHPPKDDASMTRVDGIEVFPLVFGNFKLS